MEINVEQKMKHSHKTSCYEKLKSRRRNQLNACTLVLHASLRRKYIRPCAGRMVVQWKVVDIFMPHAVMCAVSWEVIYSLKYILCPYTPHFWVKCFWQLCRRSHILTVYKVVERAPTCSFREASWWLVCLQGSCLVLTACWSSSCVMFRRSQSFAQVAEICGQVSFMQKSWYFSPLEILTPGPLWSRYILWHGVKASAVIVCCCTSCCRLFHILLLRFLAAKTFCHLLKTSQNSLG